MPTLSNPTVADLVHQPLALASELAVTGEFPALPWVAYICAGLVVGRSSMSRARTAGLLLVVGTATALAARAVSQVLLQRYGGLDAILAAVPASPLTWTETTQMLTFGGDGTVPPSTWWWLAVAAPHTSTTPDLLGTTGSAVALLGALLLAGHVPGTVPSRATRMVLRPLAAAGSMTSTLYTAHIMFINSDYDTYSATNGYLLQAGAALFLGLAGRRRPAGSAGGSWVPSRPRQPPGGRAAGSSPPAPTSRHPAPGRP